MSIVCLVLGTIFLGYGICLILRSNLNFGVWAVAGIGLVILLYGIFFEKINAVTQTGIMKYLKMAVIIMLTAELGLVGFLAVYGERDNVTYKEDAVVVLGAGVRGERITLPLKYRLDKAIEYSAKNPKAVIVVTGGQGFQETVTEAYAMEKYLLANGVSRDKIIKEEKATSTNENLRFSNEILDKLLGEGYEIAVITNGFHIYRSVSIARNEGFENVRHIHAGLQWYNIFPCYLRESMAVIKMWILG